MMYNLQKIIKQILTESDSRYDKFIKLITDFFDKTLDINGKVTNPEYYVNGDENTTWLKYLTYNFRHTFNLMQNSDMKYLYPFAKIAYYDLKFDLTDDFQSERTELKQIINLCKKQTGLFEKYIQGKDLNFKQLHDIFKPILDEIKNSEENIINNTEYKQNTNYEIIEVKSFNLANEIGKYSGVENGGELCYTETKQTWDSYTKNGLNKVYCCLSTNWKNIKPEKNEGYPKDKYGLSMIFVFVSPEGELVNSNVRWNHGDGGFGNVDNMFTKSELSELVGVNFNQVFKPLTREEMRSMGMIMFDEVQGLLDSGKKPEEIFERVGDFSDGFAWVQLNGKRNFIDSNRQLLSNQWFDDIYSFSDGFAIVELNHKYNFIGENGQLLSNQWFERVGYFSDGFAWVQLNNKYNFINTNDKLLSNQWFDDVKNFSNGFSEVKLNNKYNFINTNAQLISNQWFELVGRFSYGFAWVQLNGKYNFINPNAQLLSNQWFDDAYSFSYGFAEVKLNGKWNFIDSKGNLYDKNKKLIKKNETNENKNMKKQVIKINENQLTQIVKESVKRLLKEDTGFKFKEGNFGKTIYNKEIK